LLTTDIKHEPIEILSYRNFDL